VDKRRIVIVGGGISGLSLAYRLEQRLPAADVTVLEQRPRTGGVIGTESHDGFRLETGPNGFLDNKPATLTLCRDLGLSERLVAASETAGRNRFLLLEGRLHLLPSSLWSFLWNGVLSWRAKLALLTERFRLQRSPSSDESIDAFARRRVGAEIAETLADAFVTGIYAGDPRLLSVHAAFPRLAAMERDFGSVSRGLAQARKQRRREAATLGQPSPERQRMWSFREGLRLLTDTLRERLRRVPLTGACVRRLLFNNGTWIIEGEGQDRWSADAAILTCPAYRQADLLRDHDPELAAQLGAIPYARIVVVGLGYRAGDVAHSLDGFGYLTPQRERRDVLGVQWCSSIFPERAPPGMVLLRALCGGWNRPDIVDWDDDRLLRAVRAELSAVLGADGDPVFHRIIRWDRGIPQYHIGHLARVAWIDERRRLYPGLYLGGNAYYGVALNDCIEQADLLATEIARAS
jgi:oxygen-dependent protoporphyrinogen oxidase